MNITGENAKLIINQKINEYINLLDKIYNGNCQNEANKKIKNSELAKFKAKLQSFNVLVSYEELPGDARVNNSEILLCIPRLKRTTETYGEYFLDEVLFHEFTHIINDFRNSIYGKDSFIIYDSIVKNFDNWTSPELLEQDDELLKEQDPCFGVALLDEYIAQSISQKLVLTKYENMDYYSKNNYSKNNALSEYYDHLITTYICQPPMQLTTSLADYPEFDSMAKVFIKKIGFNNVDDFIYLSLKKGFLKELIDNPKINSIQLYSGLSYLGIVYKKVYTDRGFYETRKPNDPANNPVKVRNAMEKILDNGRRN